MTQPNLECDDVVFIQKAVNGIFFEHFGAAIPCQYQHLIAVLRVNPAHRGVDFSVGISGPVTATDSGNGGGAAGQPQLLGSAGAVVNRQFLLRDL